MVPPPTASTTRRLTLALMAVLLLVLMGARIASVELRHSTRAVVRAANHHVRHMPRLSGGDDGPDGPPQAASSFYALARLEHRAASVIGPGLEHGARTDLRRKLALIVGGHGRLGAG